MKKPEFDQYAEQYDLMLGEAIPEPLNEDSYFAEYKVTLMAKLLGTRAIMRILDFGCGAGRSLPYLDKHFPDSELWGYDVSPASLKLAAKRTPRAKLFSGWNEVPDVHFDAIIAANVFHHIPPQQRIESLAHCRESLAPKGQMFLFEHNPFNPVTRHIFERCPFDADAEMLSMRDARALAISTGLSISRCGYTLFFPRPLAFLRRLEPLLSSIPLGAQYYVQMEK